MAGFSRSNNCAQGKTRSGDPTMNLVMRTGQVTVPASTFPPAPTRGLPSLADHKLHN